MWYANDDGNDEELLLPFNDTSGDDDFSDNEEDDEDSPNDDPDLEDDSVSDD